MPTNLIIEKTTEQFMADYTPVYEPLYPLFMKKAVAHPEKVGELTLKRLEAVGDLRTKIYLPKDTEIKQVSVGENKRSFKKYFGLVQYRSSTLQDEEGAQDIVTQVLDEHQRQYDENVLYGGKGPSASVGDILNNGIFLSNDPNYVLEASKEIAKGVAEDHLRDMHAKIMATVTKANTVAGEKVLIIYGSTACEKFDSLYVNTDAPFKTVLKEVLEANWSITKIPDDVQPAGNGWIAVNLDQIKLHYTTMPKLDDNNTNSEMKYHWFNFMMGSAMVEVLTPKGIVRQPVTFQA